MSTDFSTSAQAQPTNNTAHLHPCEVCGAPGVIVLGVSVPVGFANGYEVRKIDYTRPPHVRCAAHCGTSGSVIDAGQP